MVYVESWYIATLHSYGSVLVLIDEIEIDDEELLGNCEASNSNPLGHASAAIDSDQSGMIDARRTEVVDHL